MKKKNLLLSALVGFAMVAAAGSALAASAVWNPGTTDFNLGTNWTGGTGADGIPGTADNATFGGTAGTQPILTSSITISALTFNATASNYDISSSSGSLTLTSAAAGNSTRAITSSNTTGTNTISAPLILGQAATTGAEFSQLAGGTLAITGPISSTYAISGMTLGGGAGSKFTLSGNNTYSGTTNLVATQLNINSATAISSGNLVTGSTGVIIDNTSGAAITLTNNNSYLAGGTLTYGGTYDLNFGTGSFISNSTTKTILTNGTGTLTFGSLDATVSGVGFIKSGGTGTGALAITGAAGENLTGLVLLSTGTVIIGNKSSLGTGTVQLNGGTLSASNNLSGVGNTVANEIAFAASSTFGGSNSIELSGNATVTAARSLTNSISGGNLTLSGATLGLGNGSAAFLMTLAGTGNTIINSVIQDNGAAGSLTINNPGGTVTLNGTNTYTGTTTVSGGTLVLSGNNTAATGNVAVNGGALVLSGSGTIGASTANLTLGGGSMDLGATSQTVGAVSITAAASSGATIGNGNLTGASYAASNASGNATVSANLLANGSAGLTKSGAGTLVLTGTNTYTGGTTASAGALNFGTSGLGTTGNITLTGGTLQYAEAANTQDVGSRLRTTGANMLKIDVNNNAVTFGSALTAANIAGTGGLTLTSTAAGGSLTLTGTNTYTGLTTVTSGTLKLAGAGGTLASGNNLTTAAAGTFDINGNSQTLGALVNAGTVTNSGAGTPTLTITSPTASSGPTGSITGAMNLVVTNNTGTFVTGIGTANNTGTITNSGTGTGTTTITTVGSNVTGITENSTTSALTITTLNVASGGTTLTNSLGNNKILTVTTSVAGTGNLTLNNNSTLSVGITLNGEANNTGSITNSGTGTGTTLITGTIGTNVNGGVIQNAAGTLLINGLNTFTSGLSVIKGTVSSSQNGTTGFGNGAISLGNTAGGNIDNAAILYTGTSTAVANAITVNAGSSGILAIEGNTAATNAFTGNITLNNALTLANLTAAKTTTFSGTITGSSAINIGNTGIANAGVVAITGANNGAFTGNTVANGGTLTFGTGGLGNGSGTITLVGGTLQYAAAANIDDVGSRLRTTGANTLKIDVNNNVVTFGSALTAANIAGTGGLTLTSTAAGGSLTLTGANTYTGNTTVTSGTLKLAGAGGTLASGNNLTTAAAGTFDINGNSQTLGALVNAGNVTNSGAGTPTLTITSPTASSSTGSITGVMNLVVTNNTLAIATGIGTANNTGTITNSGTGTGTTTITTVGSNVTGITENSTTSALTVTTLNVASGGTTLTNLRGTKILTVANSAGSGDLTIKNNSTLANGVTLTTGNNTGTITNSGNGTGTSLITTVGTNVTGITENSTTSALTITTLNVNSGGTTLTNLLGTAKLTVTNSVAGTGNLTLNNNSVLAAGITLTGGANNTGSITNSGTNSTGTTTITGVIGTNVNGGVIQNGAGTLAINGLNTFTSGLTVTKGTVSSSQAGATGFGNGAISLGNTAGGNSDNAAILYTGASVLVANAITVNAGSSGILAINGQTNSQTFTGTIALNNDLTVANLTAAKTTTFSNSITGSSTITISSGNLGIVALSGANGSSFTGNTVINGGTLNFANHSLGDGSGAITFGGGTLQYAAAANTQDVSARIANSSGAIKIDANNNAIVFGGALGSSNTGGLTLTSTAGTGSLTLTGDNAYSGNTTLGTSVPLNINSATAIGSGALVTTGAATINNTSGSAVILSNNNNLNLQGVATQTLTFTGTNDLSFGSGVLTIEQTARTVTTTAGTLTVGSINSLSTATTFTKAGAGTLAITGAAGANFQGGTSLVTGGLLLGNKAALGTGLITIAPSNPASISASTDLSGVNAITNNVLFSSAGTSTFNLSGSNNLTLNGSFTIGANKTVTVTNTAATELSGSIYLSDVAGTGYRLSLTNTIASAVLTVSGDIANYSGGAGTAGSILWTGGVGTTLRLTGTNSTYTGVTGYGGTAGSSTIEVTKLANGGVNSSIGASTSAASNLVIGQAGVLRYVGGGDSTDRLFTLDGTSGTGNYNIASSGSGAIEFTNTGSIVHTGLANAARTLYLRGSNTDDNIFAPVWTNNGSGVNTLVKMETGTWVLTGANSYTGETRMGVSGGTDAGILRLSGAGKISTAATTVFSGSLDVAGTTQTITSLSLGAGASGTAANVLIGSGGVLNLGSNVSYVATNNPNGATISGAGILNLNGNRTLAVDDSTAAAADLTISSIIADGSTASAITKSGTGTLILSGDNTNTGGTTLTTGTLGVSHNNALGTGALTLSGTVTLQAVNNDVVLPNAINVTGAMAFTVSGLQNLTVNGTFTAGSGILTNSIGSGKLLTLGNMDIGTGDSKKTVIMSGTGDTAVIGTIADGPSASVGQAMSVRSTGITTFSGNNTYSAHTGITAGATLVITNVADANVANALGMSPNAVTSLTLTNATLKYTGAAASTDRLFTISGAADGDYATLDASGTGAIDFTNAGALGYGTPNQTRTLNLTGTNTGNNTLAALLLNNGTGASSLNKSGAGTWVLSGNSTYTGATTVSDGTLAFTSGNASATGTQSLGGNATVSLGVASASSGILSYTGAGAATLAKNINALGNGADTIQNSGGGQLTLSGTLTKNGTVLTLKGGSSGINVTGAIVGANPGSDLVVDGGNTTLSATNTYTGATMVLGTLEITGNLTATVQVAVNGGSLLIGANEAINDAATVAMSGGTIAMGGAFTETLGALTLSANSTLDFGSSASQLGFGGFTPAGFILNIANWTASDHLRFTGTQESNLNNFNFSGFGPGAAQIDLGGNSFEIVAVPEPGTGFVALVLLGGLAFAERRRLKRHAAALRS